MMAASGRCDASLCRRSDHFFSAQDGARLYYAERGSPRGTRPTVLCLPGLARTGADFDDMAEHFCGRYRILAPDYRGRGRSQPSPHWRDYHPRRILDDLRHLIAVSGAHRLVVVGTSFGGALAMALGAMMPTALAGVVLNDIGPKVDLATQRHLLDVIGRDHPQPDWPAAERFLRETFPHLPAYGSDGWGRLARRTFRAGEDGRLHVMWDPAIVRPFRKGAVVNGLLEQVYRSLGDIPVMVVRGALSNVLDEDGLRAMIAARPDLVHVTVPGVGHAPSLGEPVVLEMLNDFLDRLA